MNALFISFHLFSGSKRVAEAMSGASHGSKMLSKRRSPRLVRGVASTKAARRWPDPEDHVSESSEASPANIQPCRHDFYHQFLDHFLIFIHF